MCILQSKQRRRYLCPNGFVTEKRGKWDFSSPPLIFLSCCSNFFFLLRYVNPSLSHLQNNEGIGLNPHAEPRGLLSWREAVLQQRLLSCQGSGGSVLQVKRVGPSSASRRGALLAPPRPGPGSCRATEVHQPLAHPIFGPSCLVGSFTSSPSPRFAPRCFV